MSIGQKNTWRRTIEAKVIPNILPILFPKDIQETFRTAIQESLDVTDGGVII